MSDYIVQYVRDDEGPDVVNAQDMQLENGFFTFYHSSHTTAVAVVNAILVKTITKKEVEPCDE